MKARERGVERYFFILTLCSRCSDSSYGASSRNQYICCLRSLITCEPFIMKKSRMPWAH